MNSDAYEDRILVPETTRAFTWIVVLGALGAVYSGFGIGANDVANAFATSVGSKALTLRQAICCAAVFEFLGAMLLGSHVGKTIRTGIADVECFEDNPPVLMYGMMCVMYTTGSWLLLATYLELPVSTTHATIGGIVGMAMAYRGPECVVWYREANHFPFIVGITGIVMSWFLSPLFSGMMAATVFGVVRKFVLRSEHSLKRSFWVFPILVCLLVAFKIFFVVYNGDSGLGLNNTELKVAFIYAYGIGGVVGLITIPTIIPFLRRKVKDNYHDDGTVKRLLPRNRSGKEPANGGAVRKFFADRLDQDVHAVVRESSYVAQIHANAEKFDPRVEEVFKYVQVVTAITDSFGHGANNVANAMGPFTAIYAVYVDGAVHEKNQLGREGWWMLALGAMGIVAGLTAYGYKIIVAIGVKIAKITPSRGFSIELGSAMVIIMGSHIEFPLSTTHCQVGATAAVALLEGTGAVNSVVLIRTVFGWVVTIVLCALACALLFSAGIYAPYVDDTIDIVESNSLE